MVLVVLIWFLSSVSFQDGERRGAGADREEGGGHTEEPETRCAQIYPARVTIKE